MIGIVIIVILIIIIILILYNHQSSQSFTNIPRKVFKIPYSLTKVNTTIQKGSSEMKRNLLTSSLCCEDKDSNKLIEKVNFLNMPSFFFANEKWPGCLPRPLFQGSCGSCWGFAVVTCLSSRFFIESCGIGGCDNYPQINFGSVNKIYNSINETYKFRKIYNDDIFKYIDKNNDKIITKKEWTDITKITREKIWSDTVTDREKHLAVQILVFMLDFQSLGSINLGSEKEVAERADLTFDVWLKYLGSQETLDVNDLREKWDKEPLALSAEKLIACCIKCMEIDFKSQKEDNPLCMGGRLDDAWILVRDTGTTTALCVGYNMDKYTPDDHAPTCRESQGPFYGFCTGYIFNQGTENTQKILEEYEKSGINPIAIEHDAKVPWVDPQLFRFRAKNAYVIPNDVEEIQREIFERGPVTTGFVVYYNFQFNFGKTGGQLFDWDNPVGSHDTALIYMKDDEEKEEEIGGHAVTIVGWGVYHQKINNKTYKIPYWICLNSWGIEWGHSGFPAISNRNGLPNDMTQGGYFWMIRGLNNCGIEENFIAGQPNIENITYPGVIDTYGWGLPGPDENKVKFLPRLVIEDLNFEGGDKLDVLPALSGGGMYIDYKANHGKEGGTWEMKSMLPPSPYTMFWPLYRPVFCMGYSLSSITNKITDNVIKIDESVYISLSKVISVYSNPLLIIGDKENQEQIQLINLSEDEIKVNRAVNYNELFSHEKNSKIKVFPYQSLELNFFKNNGFIQCEM